MKSSENECPVQCPYCGCRTDYPHIHPKSQIEAFKAIETLRQHFPEIKNWMDDRLENWDWEIQQTNMMMNMFRLRLWCEKIVNGVFE